MISIEAIDKTDLVKLHSPDACLIIETPFSNDEIVASIQNQKGRLAGKCSIQP